MDLSDLMEQSDLLPDGLQKVVALEEIVRHLELRGDTRTAFERRLELIESAMGAGLHERSLVAFVAYLHQFDSTPELQNDYEPFLHAYFGVVWFAVDQPAIPLSRIDQMFDDLRSRFTSMNLNQRPVDHLRWRVDMAVGQLDRAQALCDQWRKERTTNLCYDRACQLDSVVELYFRRGLFREAIEAANPIFKQNLRSDPVPGLTYCNVLAAYLALGDVEQAEVYAQKLQQLLKSRHSLGSLYENSFLFVYFVNRRMMKEARKLFDRYVKWASETKDLDNICLFLNAAVGMFQVLSESKATITLRLPTELSWYRASGKYSPAELATEIECSIKNMCRMFDSRNQNSAYTDRIQFFRQLCLNGNSS